mmetsp:Transcript_32709/g.56928  ORF Transcript_32709/g.56928 Transcript_32709/m.56928 type:complete len:108 (+) Transcript_32709:2621-2944(+)
MVLMKEVRAAIDIEAQEHYFRELSGEVVEEVADGSGGWSPDSTELDDDEAVACVGDGCDVLGVAMNVSNSHLNIRHYITKHRQCSDLSSPVFDRFRLTVPPKSPRLL